MFNYQCTIQKNARPAKQKHTRHCYAPVIFVCLHALRKGCFYSLFHFSNKKTCIL